MKNKKNKKGFSAVELLAIIVVIAIVLVAVVPRINESMHNARKDSFVKIADKILDSVKNNYIEDNLICYGNSNDIGTSIVNIENTKVIVPFGNISGININNKLKSLLVGNTVSSFGKSELSGYVVINIFEKNQDYSIAMTDSNNHFLNIKDRCELSTSELIKENVIFDDNGSCTVDKLTTNLISSSQVLCKIKK